MADTIMPVFKKFAKEGELIGRLMASYSELELLLCFCVSHAIDDFDMAFKAMFRTRGETQRIDIADSMGRQKYIAVRLGTPFSESVSAVKYCLSIRNNYAHCHWHDDNTGDLAFVQLELTAKLNTPVHKKPHRSSAPSEARSFLLPDLNCVTS